MLSVKRINSLLGFYGGRCRDRVLKTIDGDEP